MNDASWCLDLTPSCFPTTIMVDARNRSFYHDPHPSCHKPRLRLWRCHALCHRGGLRKGIPREAHFAVASHGEIAAEREGTAAQETGIWKRHGKTMMYYGMVII